MRDNILSRLRWYQQLLIVGGGTAITILVLGASLLQVGASVSSYIASTREEMSADVRRAQDLIARTAATLRDTVSGMQLAALDSDAFNVELHPDLTSGHVLQLSQGRLLPPLFVLRANGSETPAAQYLQLAREMVAVNAIMAARISRESIAYLVSRDRKLMVLSASPWQNVPWMSRLVESRREMLESTASLAEQLANPPGSLRHEAVPGLPTLHWLPPYDSPLTGQRAIRIAADIRGGDGNTLATAVFELPLATLAATLPHDGPDGTCLIFDAGQRPVLSCRKGGLPENLLVIEQAVANGLGTSAQLAYREGEVLAAWTLGSSHWTLVYTQSWRNIASAIGPQLMTSVAAAGLIIVTCWSFLLLLKWRVFIPAIAQSQRVFENEHLGRTLVDTAPVGLGLIAIHSGKPLLRSPAMMDADAQLLTSRQGLSGELAAQFLLHENQPAPHDYPGALQLDLRFPTIDGSHRDLSVRMARARYEGVDVLVAAFTDVTLEKQMERVSQEAQHAADSANAAKSAFLAAMSHEIRTPLNAIHGNLELLSHSALDSAQRAHVDTIRSASDSLLSIVSDVLDFSKIEAGELRLEHLEYDIQDIAARALIMFSTTARAKGLVLGGEFGLHTTQPMRGDPTRVAQVINNLLSNAVKFTAAGKVTLRMTQDATPPQLVLTVEDSGIGMSPEQMSMLFQAFTQADITINRRFGGTGLGLALCSRLSQAMGGTLSVTSKAGQGSCFTLRLPLDRDLPPAQLPSFAREHVLLVAADDAQRNYLIYALSAWGLAPNAYAHPAQINDAALQQAAVLVLWGSRDTWHPDDENRIVEDARWVLDCSQDAPARPAAAGRILSVTTYGLASLEVALNHVLRGHALAAPAEPGKVLQKRLRVLVVEDNPLNQRLFQDQLNMLGCDARVACGGHEALSWLEQESYDVLLTDLSMPEMSGYELAAQVGTRYPALPIVAVTADVNPQTCERCAACGMVRVLDKPLSLEDLGHTLSEVSGVTRLHREPVAPRRRRTDKALPDPIWKIFLASSESSLTVLRQAWKNDDIDVLLAELHSLRGAFGVFQLQTLAEQCAELSKGLQATGIAANTAGLLALCEAMEAIVSMGSPDVSSLLGHIIELANDPDDQRRRLRIETLARLAQVTLEQNRA
ncbi:hybrid sensor histidine kinase/response regulator [Bordetella avium]|uniref:hybrid sensor histidine kinase/response regulator n=1 Tax=Bordetella avium TaxID=521 RepID=UPI000FDA6504|nr:hybrid sensor histidine kinase/response regulator [Bordetella avium]AZY52506.1 hypothetical protein C0J07_08300 [Bordetella avium]